MAKLTLAQLQIQHRLRIKMLRLKLEAVRYLRRQAKDTRTGLKALAKRARNRGDLIDAAKSLEAQALFAGTQVAVTNDMLKFYTDQLEQELKTWRRR